MTYMGGNTHYLFPATRRNANTILAYMRKETQKRLKKSRWRPEFMISKIEKETGVARTQVSYAVLILVLLGKARIKGKVFGKNSGQIRTATMVKYIGDLPK